MIEQKVHSNAFVYQNMVNLIVGFPIWRHPSIFMDAVMWERRTFDPEIFRCGKVLPIVGLKMSSLPVLALNLLTKFSCGIKKFIRHTFQVLIEAVLHIISFILCWGMNVQNNDLTPTTS
jgi:hypothetical protein